MNIEMAKDNGKVICFSGGVQSTAMTLFLYSQGKRHPVAFIDVGGDWPETYQFIDLFKEFLYREFSASVYVIKTPPLFDYLWEKRIIPWSKKRLCTDRWKVRPMKKAFPNAEKLLGFSVEEVRRTKNQKEGTRFPLIEMGLTRDDCIELIKRFGLPVPERSNCWFCPFQTKKRWQILWLRHPQLYEKALALEARANGWKYKVDRSLRSFVGEEKQLMLFV